MSQKVRNILVLLSLVSLIFVLRDSKTSPGGFLQQHVFRHLASKTTFSDTLCEGVDREDNVSAAENDKMASFRASLSNARGGNLLVDFIMGPEDKDQFGKEYVVPLVKVAVPWAVFFIVSLFICIGFVCNWCYMSYSCGPQRCRRPTTTKHQKGYRIASAFFMIAVFAIGIAGIAVSASFSTKGKETICTTAIFLDKLIEGSPSDRWIGAKPAVEKLVIVLDNLDSVAANLPLIVLPPVFPGYASTTNAINSMYNNNNGKKIRRGDQTGSPADYTPTYIQNIASNDRQIGGTGALQAEVDGKRNVLRDTPTKVNAAITLLKTGSFLVTLIADLQDFRKKATDVTKSVSDLQTSVLEGGSQGKTGMDAIGGGIIGVFSAEILIAILAMVSMIAVIRGAMAFNKLTHVSWCVLGFLVILGWILATILFPLTVGLFEGCEVVERVLVDPVFFNRTVDKFTNNASVPEDDPDKHSTRESLYRCFYGDGDILASARNVLFVFTDIAEGLDNTAYITVDPIVNSEQIDRQKPLIESYRDGLIADAPEATTDLTKLNSYTINNACNKMKDTWKFASSSCGTSDGTVFTSGRPSDYNVKSPTCVGFDVWPSTTNSIQNRYKAADFSSCGTTNGQNTDVFLQGFVNDFKTSRKAVSDLFTTVRNNLGSVESANNNFMTQVKTYTGLQYKPLRNAYDPLYQPLSNQTEGILPNAKCNFLKQSFTNVQQKLCVRFAPTIFQIAVVMIIMSFMALFGTISLFCLAKRSIERKDSKGKYMGTPQHTNH